MHYRVVRFTDVDPDRVEQMMKRVDESDGPPPGVEASGLRVVVDRDQRTAVVVQIFETADAMAAAESVFDSMDASETPGTRASIDRGELVLDLNM